MLCSKLTNLPLQLKYEVEMDNYQFSSNHHTEYMLANYNVLVGSYANC